MRGEQRHTPGITQLELTWWKRVFWDRKVTEHPECYLQRPRLQWGHLNPGLLLSTGKRDTSIAGFCGSREEIGADSGGLGDLVVLMIQLEPRTLRKAELPSADKRSEQGAPSSLPGRAGCAHLWPLWITLPLTLPSESLALRISY